MDFEIEVNGKTFSGLFADTEAAKELKDRLPLTMRMSELSGNEKYCFTGKEFPGKSTQPKFLRSGEVWIYSGDCVVLFYEDHPNPGYSYRYVGALDNTAGLAEAVGSGEVTVSFRQRD